LRGGLGRPWPLGPLLVVARRLLGEQLEAMIAVAVAAASA